MRRSYTVLVGKLNRRDNFGGIGINERIILKWIGCEMGSGNLK
jgi:hypothetical protein